MGGFSGSRVAWIATVTAIAAATLGATAVGASTAVSVAIPSPVAAAPTWAHQLGSPKSDTGESVAVDAAGNSYVLGESEDHLAPSPEGESGAVFIAKYAPGGARQWVHQFGTSGVDHGCGVVTDAAGNSTIIGYGRDAAASVNRAWLAHFDADGTFESRATIAVAPSGCLPGAALDRFGDLYYSGGVNVNGGLTGVAAAVLVRVDPSGTVAWTRQLAGSESVIGTSVAVDHNGNVYLGGYAGGTVDGAPDHLETAQMDHGFLARYDRDGTRKWVHEFSNLPSSDSTVVVRGVAVDARGNVAVTGRTTATLPGSPDANVNENNAFVIDLTAGGKVRWVRQLTALNGPFPGTYGKYGGGIAALPDGNIVITGITVNFPPGDHGQPEDSDAFLAEFDSVGALAGYDEVASPSVDLPESVAVDRFGNVIVTGSTFATITGSTEPNAGDYDAFVLHYQAESTVSIANAKAHARSGTLQFVATLDQPSPTIVAVQYETADGTALAGDDYQHTSGVVVFLAGETTASIPVPLDANSGKTGHLTFSVVLSNPAGIVIARSHAVGTIILPRA